MSASAAGVRSARVHISMISNALTRGGQNGFHSEFWIELRNGGAELSELSCFIPTLRVMDLDTDELIVFGKLVGERAAHVYLHADAGSDAHPLVVIDAPTTELVATATVLRPQLLKAPLPEQTRHLRWLSTACAYARAVLLLGHEPVERFLRSSQDGFRALATFPQQYFAAGVDQVTRMLAADSGESIAFKIAYYAFHVHLSQSLDALLEQQHRTASFWQPEPPSQSAALPASSPAAAAITVPLAVPLAAVAVAAVADAVAAAARSSRTTHDSLAEQPTDLRCSPSSWLLPGLASTRRKLTWVPLKDAVDALRAARAAATERAVRQAIEAVRLVSSTYISGFAGQEAAVVFAQCERIYEDATDEPDPDVAGARVPQPRPISGYCYFAQDAAAFCEPKWSLASVYPEPAPAEFRHAVEAYAAWVRPLASSGIAGLAGAPWVCALAITEGCNSFAGYKCAGCSEPAVRYCSPACQKKHWRVHARVCARLHTQMQTHNPSASVHTSL